MSSSADETGSTYRGRLAPSPTGFLHLGHARTFWVARERARDHAGRLVMRMEDLDSDRCRPEFDQAILEDLHWFGLTWDEGPDSGGAFSPYRQSECLAFYESAFQSLKERRLIYPCNCSRRDVMRALEAPHAGDEEPVYPGTCRPKGQPHLSVEQEANPRRYHWRFRVPDGETISFVDGALGHQQFTAGKDFGDFVVWRQDGWPSYQLAVVVDDVRMQITEVVRGADLLTSTARQLLLYRALGWRAPAFFHCPLVRDEGGVRLAKRHESLSLRGLRAQGFTASALRIRSEFQATS